MAAPGVTVSAWATKAANATTDIQPPGAEQWEITTLIAGSGKSMEIYLTEDGVTFTLVETLTAGGSVHGLTWRLTNGIWMRLKNVSLGVAYNGYQGVVTQ